VTVAAVVLAAGAGSRFAGPVHKLLADLRGRPVVAWAVDAAVAAGLDEVLVVTGAADLTGVLPTGVRIVHNPAWASGLASSLQAAVAAATAAGHEAIVVGLGDQPFVPTSAWRAVADADSPLAVAVFGAPGSGGAARPPVRIHRSLWSELPTEGDEGARGLLRRCPELVVRVPCGGDSADVDTLEDLERWN
jgi:CTP:molybdopterin cytidylyltransferase MocA